MEQNSQSKPFWEHVADARQLLFIVVGVFLVSAGVTHYFHQTLIAFLLRPLDTSDPLQFLSPLEPLFFILKIDFIGALVVTLPVTIMLAYRFVRPGTARSFVVPFLVLLTSTMLALTGAAYSYYVIIPIVLAFMQSLIMPGMVAAFTAMGFIDFVLGTAMLLVLLFQIPILTVALSHIGLFNPYEFASYRRNVYLGIIVATAVITPTTDILTLLLVSMPALCITEIGVLVGRLVYTRTD